METLLYQANARSADLLWDPVNTAHPGPRRGGQGAARSRHRRSPGVQCAARSGGRRRAARRRGARSPECAARRRRGVRVPAGLAEGVRPRPRRAGRVAAAVPSGAGRFHRAMERGLESTCPASDPGYRRVHRACGTGAAELSRRNCTTRPAPPSCPAHAFLGSAVRAQSLPADLARVAGGRPGAAAGLRQLRQFPVRARGCALPRRCRAPVAAGAGGPGDRLRRPGRARASHRRIGWCGNSCRRSPCSSTRR